MLSKVTSAATFGLESIPITVEVDIADRGLPSFTIVGLPNKAVEESKERVRAAIRNSGADFPARRITVNLAPADIPKQGPSYDLPIACGILIASGQMIDDFKDAILYGELSLDGSLRHTNSILPTVILAKDKKIKKVFIPDVDTKEASIVDNITVYGLHSLLQLFLHSSKKELIKASRYRKFDSLIEEGIYEFDFADIRGQQFTKRALEIASSGGHNIHLKGIPGAGKTMLARALPGIMPVMTESEALEVTKIYSISGNIPQGESIIKHRPFRSPHHTISRIGLVGGGSNPQPGEITLAHRGVLFMDEFPEFPRNVLEALRQPLEDGVVHISRAAGTVTYPSRFIFVAASNPCPCGFFMSDTNRCKCNPNQIINYNKKISGPLIDRIDLHVEVAGVKVDELINSNTSLGESSKTIRRRIENVREKQKLRFKTEKILLNGEMNGRLIKKYVQMENDAEILLKKAITSFKLSARSYFKIIKIGQTIADMDNSKIIKTAYIAEALQYRLKEDF